MSNPIVEAFIETHHIIVEPADDKAMWLHDVRALIAQLIPEGSVVVPRETLGELLHELRTEWPTAYQYNKGRCDKLAIAIVSPNTKAGGQIAAEPKCYCGTSDFCPRHDHKPSPSDTVKAPSVEGSVCACGKPKHEHVGPWLYCPESHRDKFRDCHEVATPGAEKKGENL